MRRSRGGFAGRCPLRSPLGAPARNPPASVPPQGGPATLLRALLRADALNLQPEDVPRAARPDRFRRTPCALTRQPCSASMDASAVPPATPPDNLQQERLSRGLAARQATHQKKEIPGPRGPGTNPPRMGGGDNGCERCAGRTSDASAIAIDVPASLPMTRTKRGTWPPWQLLTTARAPQRRATALPRRSDGPPPGCPPAPGPCAWSA